MSENQELFEARNETAQSLLSEEVKHFKTVVV
jgi:hypothetical protein